MAASGDPNLSAFACHNPYSRVWWHPVESAATLSLTCANACMHACVQTFTQRVQNAVGNALNLLVFSQLIQCHVTKQFW